MSQTLRRSARLRNKLTQYTDPTTSDDESNDNSSSDYSSSDTTKLHCICNKPQDHRLMICCDECNIWHHHDCINLTKSQANKLSKSNKKWYCISCKKKGQTNTNKKSNKKRKRNHIQSITNSPPNKKRKQNTNTNITPQQAIRTLFKKLSNKQINNPSNPCFQLPFAPKEIEQNTDNTNNDTDSDLEILPNNTNTNTNNCNNSNALSIAPVIAFILETDKLKNKNKNKIINKQIKHSESESDDEILISAGDKWVKRESFMENKELFKRDIINKKKENINKYINKCDNDLNDKDFVVLNENKICKQNVCPITLKQIKNPIKNVLCKHIYEKDAIINYKEYMNKNEKELLCPQAGCNKYLWIVQ